MPDETTSGEVVPGWYDVEGAGQRLLLTYRQLLDRIRDGKISARKVGHKYLIETEELERYDRERRENFRVMPDGSGDRGYGQL